LLLIKDDIMKRIILITLSLIIIIVIGYVIYLVIKSDPSVADPQPVKIDNDNQAISEWREENRTGVSAETGLLTSWPEGGPELIWMTTELPRGYSSVTFGNNTIYTTGFDGENDVLIALDSYGKIKWQTSYGRPWMESDPESRCTPTVEGDKVYVSSGFGDLACIDGISGEIIWSLEASEIYKGTYGQWGIAESLIIDGEKIYFSPGGPETMTIALDKTTGELIWKSESLDSKPGYVSPILIEYAGKKMIINVSLSYIFAVDASDGTILWKIRHEDTVDHSGYHNQWPTLPLIKCVTPLYKDGKIYVTGGYDTGAVMLAMNDDGTDVTVVWTDKVLDVHHGGVVLIDGYIYGANWINNGEGYWCCVEWNTGKKMWEEEWNKKGSIISAEGLLYIYDERHGNVGLLRPDTEKFDLISSFRIKEGSGPYWAHPVINNGVLYIRHGEALIAFDIKK
jgi:outer membrane protein assembly factor BamB